MDPDHRFSAVIALRPAVAADYDAFVPMFGELGVPEAPPSRETFAARYLTNMTVATAGEQVVGFIRWRAYADLAHVINVVTHAAWRGRRIGQHLLEAAKAQAQLAGCTHWYLNVKQTNAPAIALYLRCGFVTESASVVLRMPWAAVRTLPVPAGVVATIATESDDPVLAAQFQLPAGRVVYMREKSQLLVARTQPDPALRGCASFYAGMPGVAPLYATDLATAGALLHGCLAFAEPEPDSLIVVVERHPALAAELRAHGAATEFELLTMTARM